MEDFFFSLTDDKRFTCNPEVVVGKKIVCVKTDILNV